MEEFIVQYWLQVFFGLIIAILSGCYVRITTEVKRREAETKALKNGVLAMLHDRMWQAGRFYLNNGSISMEELNNFDGLYEAYHALGGNGTGTEIYHRIHQMKIKN